MVRRRDLNGFYAICPICGKSIFIGESSDNQAVCSVCGQALDLSALRDKGDVIDVEAVAEEYKRAWDCFTNSDFKEAEIRFRKVLTYNRNHYLADYYAAVCEIYENEDKPEYNVPARLCGAIVGSADKLELCRVGIQARIDFLRAVFGQTHIILSAHLSRIYENFEKTEMWDIVRDKCLDIAAGVYGIANIDKERLAVFDPEISRLLVRIADLAVCACRKTVQPHIYAQAKLDLPTDYQYEKAESYYRLLTYFISSLDSAYESAYKPDYTANLLFNESVTQKLDAYEKQNRERRKKHMSAVGGAWETFCKDAELAVKYSYHTCFKALIGSTKDTEQAALSDAAVLFGFALLLPRFYTDSEKKVLANVLPQEKTKDLAFCLNRFLSEIAKENAKRAESYANDFFRRIYDATRYHFTSVMNAYEKSLDKLKESQNSEYRYLKNFLHGIIHCCALGGSEIVSAGAASERIRLLKLGKQATEEFLLLNDYKVEELEQSVKYSDVLDLYNAFDEDIAACSGKHKT